MIQYTSNKQYLLFIFPENPKKVKTTAKSAQQKRSRKAGAEPQGENFETKPNLKVFLRLMFFFFILTERQKKQQSAAKTVNDSALKLKVRER